MVSTIGSTTEPGPVLRLLYCNECGGSIDELPPFVGRPEDDVALARCIEDMHTNSVTGAHHGLLFTVPVSAWVNETAKRQVIKQIREGLSSGIDEVDDAFYATRNNLRDDAMECYGKHLRPKGACPDYMSDSKKVLPPTAAARKEMGLPKPSEAGVGIWTCSSCPVNVYMITKRRSELGMYR